MTATALHVDSRIIAPRLSRFGAWLVDIVVCAILVSGLQQLFSVNWDEPVNLLPGLAYFVLFHTWSGRTPGKWLLGIKVVARGTDRPPSWWASALRSVWLLFPLIPVVDWVVGLADWLWSFYDRDKRCLHDVLAGTVVVIASAKD
ncbi:RDD family protein [Nonomuraea rubra]|uniref:RDD family protein n=1 Tax=Nonomuraea rubra TaxID=46180 RepID=UPI0033D73B15